MKKIFLSMGVFAFLLVLTGVGCQTLEEMANEQIEGEKIMVGGERDEHGCLGPAGYSWDESLQVCTRNWEIKESAEKEAIKIAVESVGSETGLTVVGVETKDCEGCFVVHLTNLDNEQLEVKLKDWQVYTGDNMQEEPEEIFEENTEEKTEEQEEEKTVTPVPTSGIYLSAKAVENGIAFNWSVTNVDVSQGFKIVKSTEANPVYPGNDYIYLDNAGTRNYTWNIKDGKTYYFRICQYLGGKCGVYSQNVKVTAPLKEVFKEKETTGNVSSISVKSTGGTGVAWTTVGVSPQGFKIVWSKHSSPTYPTRSGDKYIYLSDKNSSATSLNAFDGSGTYYVRVCEYLGGKCGVYSNQITVEL